MTKKYWCFNISNRVHCEARRRQRERARATTIVYFATAENYGNVIVSQTRATLQHYVNCDWAKHLFVHSCFRIVFLPLLFLFFPRFLFLFPIKILQSKDPLTNRKWMCVSYSSVVGIRSCFVCISSPWFASRWTAGKDNCLVTQASLIGKSDGRIELIRIRIWSLCVLLPFRSFPSKVAVPIVSAETTFLLRVVIAGSFPLISVYDLPGN